MPPTIPPHEIILRTDDHGNLVAVVEGIDGPGCTDASKWLDDFGDVLVHRKRMSYYAASQVEASDTLNAGGDW